MSPELRAALRLIFEAYPAGSTVPVLREHALELLEGSADVSQSGAVDLTVAQLAARFDRKPSAVRAWLERGDIPEAYKLNGREWRVPSASVEAFQERQREGNGRSKATSSSAALGDWRKTGQTSS